MKKFRDLIVTMFFMVLIFNLLLPIGTAKADTNMKYLKVNSETLEFKEIIYIDGSNGDDNTGDGSKTKPFQSVVKGFDFMANNCKQGGAIIIADGNYDVSKLFTGTSNNLASKYNSIKLSLFAETLGNVTFDNHKEWMVVENGSSQRIKLNFYGIIMKAPYTHLGGDDWTNEYYNCVISSVFGGHNKFVKSAAIKMQNCLFAGYEDALHRVYPISGIADNCASTNTAMDPYAGTKTNALFNVTIDSNYHITSTGWENAGDGINPDGTKAHIGVYGGLFAWGTKVVEITPTNNTLKVVLEPNEQLQLSVDHDLYENSIVKWASSNPAVASVNSNGLVMALTKGDTRISVTYPDGTVDFINVLVVEDASDYRLAIDLKIGQSSRLTIDNYTFSKIVSWSTMDNNIAMISNKGKVTAVGEGLTLVNAKDDQGKVVGYIYIRVRS